MSEEALLDTPETEEVDLSTESTENSEDSSAESTETQTEGQTQTHDDTAPVISDANGQLKLSDTARAELDKIKADNPRLAREMRAALFDRQTLLAKVPGGVKEALATIEAYEAEGGSEVVQAVKAENKLWQDLDSDFQSNNPKFVEDVAAGNPEAFVAHSPAMMSKFAELAPDQFSYQVSKVFAQDMAANDFVLNMRLIKREIDALPEENRSPIYQLWDQLARYVDRVNSMAKTAPKTETKSTTEKPTGNPNLDQREQVVTLQEFGVERSRVLSSVTDSEFKKNIGSRKATETQISAIRELYETRLDKMLRSDKNHTSKVDRFFAAKDKAGYAKHMAAVYRAKAPLAMEQAFKAVMPGKPGPVTKAAPAKSAASPNKEATTTGFTRSATKPDHNAVDWQATARIPGKKGGDGKFIMRDGSKVLYQR